VAVATDAIDVEEVDHAKLAETKFQPPRGQLRKCREGTGICLNPLLAERNYSVKHHAGEIRRLSQGRIPYCVQVGETSETQRLAQSQASGFFYIDKGLYRMPELVSRVQGQNARRGLLIVGLKTVGAGVGGVEWWVCLEDEVCLSSNEQFAANEGVGKHTRGFAI